MIEIQLPPGKKIYFASDFHLGVPDQATTIAREKLLVKWLEMARQDAHSIYLVGDMFDFWFEYKHTIPKGFTRFLGKLAELRDAGLPIYFFTGNHDLWMFDYFRNELDIQIYREPQVLKVGEHKILIGHGDGLGPGDRWYKILKGGLFDNRFFQWMFQWLHPNLGMSIAHMWSKSSRISNMEKEKFQSDENEYLFKYCEETEKKEHHDFYIFGHRHLPLDLKVSENSRYINLGEWVNFSPYAVYDGKTIALKSFMVS
ncbi:MAG TPA: UDP-2,3-diacylglucosamine diphosphatase [Cyclobacteriaceae bacterium]|nr:UDP-2,3-diacylglucosamine diphosphatase [Cyclobacteriaceae bacterium]